MQRKGFISPNISRLKIKWLIVILASFLTPIKIAAMCRSSFLSPEVAESTRMPNLNRGLKLNQRCSTLSRTPECVARIQSTLESLEKSRLSFWKGVSVLCCCCPEIWGGQDDSEVLRQPTAATCRAGWQHPQHPASSRRARQRPFALVQKER